MDNLATAEGQMIIKDNGLLDIIDFKEEFVISGSIDNIDKARSFIQKIIPERLIKKNPLFKSVRTCQIMEFEQTDKIAKPSKLEYALMEALELDCLPEGLENYRIESQKIAAIEKAIFNRKNKKPAQDKMD